MNDKIMAARAALHMWEEPCISGERGSGAIFFSGCTLRCVFCQNHDIASAKVGKELSVDELSDVMLRLQDNKADNINLVTPTHFTIPIIKAIEKARNKGLRIPVVYNTSAYENVETLRMLDGIVDVYLPDFKYMDSRLSQQYSYAADYTENAKKALEEMIRQTKSNLKSLRVRLLKTNFFYTLKRNDMDDSYSRTYYHYFNHFLKECRE